jgi:hypothetical protein
MGMRNLLSILWTLPLAASLRADPPALDLGFGLNSLGHVEGHAALGLPSGDLYQAVKVMGSTEVAIFPEKLPEENMQSFGFIAGTYENRTFAFAAITGGLSVLRFEDRTGPGRPNPDCETHIFFCADSIYRTKETYTIGIPFEVLVSLKLWYVGSGLRIWVTPNLHQTMAGISSVLFIGGGPTRKRARDRDSDGD